MSKQQDRGRSVSPDGNTPPFYIPSGAIVQVSVINTTSRVANVPVSRLLTPPMEGFTHLDIPCYAFLIEHPSGRKLLFDLGIRKDLERLPARIQEEIAQHDFVVEVKAGVSEILAENGIRGEEIEAIVWSHHHWDHLGDPSTFPPTTGLIVGPGFQKTFLPGYPDNPDSGILVTDYSNRTLREINFATESQGLKIGRFDAVDYFGDGSFYILDAPGHSIGHICALARTTLSTTSATQDSFIFMGADSCHHGGEFRPSQYLPLPGCSSHPPSDHSPGQSCFTSALGELLRQRGKNVTDPFFNVAGEVTHDTVEAAETIAKVQEADAHDNVFVIMAHDTTLLDLIDFFPKNLNQWFGKGSGDRARWAFLNDFRDATRHAH